MSADTLNRAVLSQFKAALAMLDECLEKCPDDRWDLAPPNAVASYPCWQVAYHALCYVDCYLAPSNDAFADEIGSRVGGFHPAGMAELREEFPSRRFERDELRRYAGFCRERAARVLTSESGAALERPSGFGWLPMSRAELHIYNLRHLQHHVGQLTAYLRRAGVETRWVKAGRPSGAPT